jgi:hypothetical protein
MTTPIKTAMNLFCSMMLKRQSQRQPRCRQHASHYPETGYGIVTDVCLT